MNQQPKQNNPKSKEPEIKNSDKVSYFQIHLKDCDSCGKNYNMFEYCFCPYCGYDEISNEHIGNKML